MKALVVQPKNAQELKLVASLLKKMGVHSSTVSQEEIGDLGLSRLMKKVDKSKRVSRMEVMRKLTA